MDDVYGVYDVYNVYDEYYVYDVSDVSDVYNIYDVKNVNGIFLRRGIDIYACMYLPINCVSIIAITP